MKGVMVDMKEFLMLLLLIVLVLTSKDSTILKDSKGRNGLLGNYGGLYQIWMGEEPGADLSFNDWIIYFFIATAVNIIAINFLISIFSSSYDKIQAKSDAANCRTKAQVLSQMGALLFTNRDDSSQSFIHIALKANESLDESVDSSEWEGRARALSSQQEQITQHISKVDVKVDNITSDISEIRG